MCSRPRPETVLSLFLKGIFVRYINHKTYKGCLKCMSTAPTLTSWKSGGKWKIFLLGCNCHSTSLCVSLNHNSTVSKLTRHIFVMSWKLLIICTASEKRQDETKTREMRIKRFTHLQEKRLGFGSPLFRPEQLPFALPDEWKSLKESSLHIYKYLFLFSL